MQKANDPLKLCKKKGMQCSPVPLVCLVRCFTIDYKLIAR